MPEARAPAPPPATVTVVIRTYTQQRWPEITRGACSVRAQQTKSRSNRRSSELAMLGRSRAAVLRCHGRAQHRCTGLSSARSPSPRARRAGKIASRRRRKCRG
jgi:hypothetical protein